MKYKYIVTLITLGMLSGFVLGGEDDDIDVDKMLYGEGIEADMYRAGVDDVEQARAWFADLKKSIEARDEEQLITMVHFPVVIASDTSRYKIDTPEEFLSQYDKIITPRLKSILDCTSFDQLWANYSGISVGSGVIIFESIYLNDNDPEPVLKVVSFYNGSLMDNDLRKCGESARDPAQQ